MLKIKLDNFYFFLVILFAITLLVYLLYSMFKFSVLKEWTCFFASVAIFIVLLIVILFLVNIEYFIEKIRKNYLKKVEIGNFRIRKQ